MADPTDRDALVSRLRSHGYSFPRESYLRDLLPQVAEMIERDGRKLAEAKSLYEQTDLELARVSTAERDARKDSERLDWVIDRLSFNDPLEAVGLIRDWKDNADARAAIDAARED